MAANRKMTLTRLLTASSYPLWPQVLPDSATGAVDYRSRRIWTEKKIDVICKLMLVFRDGPGCGIIRQEQPGRQPYSREKPMS